MRVALLTAMEPAHAGEVAIPSLLRVGGSLIVRHQVALALAAGCQRIVCVASGFAHGFADLQRDAEHRGATFHLVTDALGLTGLITAADDVLVIAQGLLPTPGDALPLLASQGILVQPAEDGVAAGFERIDLGLAWAGMMVLPGRLVERLVQLGAEADPASALLRIGLQANVPQREVPDAARIGGHWLLIRNEADAVAAEDSWMVRHTAGGPKTPGQWLARTLVRRYGATLLHESGSSVVGAGIAGLLIVLGLAAGSQGHLVVALALAAVAWVLIATTALLLRLRGDALGQPPQRAWSGAMLNGAFDLVLIVLLTFAVPALPGQTLAERGFAPMMLIGLLRLVPRCLAGEWPDWLEDRLVVVMLLALLAAGQVLAMGVPGLAILLLIAGLVLPGMPRGLARRS